MVSQAFNSIAFYLPQFHPIRFNDTHWGEGFSDWRNVAKARPLFPGHFQPKLPGTLGFYDLRCFETLKEQADLARAHRVDTFCFYYYRFDAQRVLERPLDLFLAHREINISFLYCWANEPWTRAWDGRSNETLLEQSYRDAAFDGLVSDLTKAMRDDRHFRITGKPVFMIYQLEQVPNAEGFIGKLREALRTALSEDVIVGSVFSHGFREDMLGYLDFVTQFPPHRFHRGDVERTILAGDTVEAFEPARGDNFEPYETVMQTALEQADALPNMFLGVTPDWDNSPRRPDNAHILMGSTPELFQEWTKQATETTMRRYHEQAISAPMIFVNAWNEWGEGAMLEPSEAMGTRYLEAFSNGIAAGLEGVADAK